MYDAMDIAEYILDYCENKLEKPITNLQLQKFLYFIQGDYLVECDKPLFDNSIEAWAYGPVVPDVYYSFNDNKSNKILGIKQSVNILDSDKNIINKTIMKYINISPWDLVEKTHNQDPWIDNYIPHNNTEIPVDEIKKYFLQNKKR